jgi:protein arginine N-methyltransferase 3
MFCAKAGAKLVIAVDNSDIIERAREIVYDNGFGNVIKL